MRLVGIVDERTAWRAVSNDITMTDGRRRRTRPTQRDRPSLSLVCDLCPRCMHCEVGRFIARYGDARLTDIAAEVADCPRARLSSVFGLCRARFERL